MTEAPLNLLGASILVAAYDTEVGCKEGCYLAVLNGSQQGLQRGASPRGSNWAETIGSERALQSFRTGRHLPCQRG